MFVYSLFHANTPEQRGAVHGGTCVRLPHFRSALLLVGIVYSVLRSV